MQCTEGLVAHQADQSVGADNASFDELKAAVNSTLLSKELVEDAGRECVRNCRKNVSPPKRVGAGPALIHRCNICARVGFDEERP